MEKNLPASNEHIAKMAALPRVDKEMYFRGAVLALIQCWNAATSAICHYVKCKFFSANTGENYRSKLESVPRKIIIRITIWKNYTNF
jgi:hypothetical protein